MLSISAAEFHLRATRCHNRKSTLQRIFCHEVERDAFRVERALHHHLGSYRVAREWFRLFK